MPKIDVVKTELVWSDKYDEDGNLKKVEKALLPFQRVEIINSPRVSKKEDKGKTTLYDYFDAKEGNTVEEGWKNKLIWGDNKLIMSSLLKDFAGKINLIYIDPPFATGADFKFNVQVGEAEGFEVLKEHSIIEEKAFRDTWGKGISSYIDMMYNRLTLMKELLSDNGAIYVHCDWHVGHYLKLILDEIFGYDNFRNEMHVKRIRKNVQEYDTVKRLNVANDTILFYSKSESHRVIQPRKDEIKEERWHAFDAPGLRTGMDYPLFGKKPPVGRHWMWSKENAEEAIKEKELRPNKNTGRPEYLVDSSKSVITTMWDDISAYSFSFGYNTEKSESLLKRIIEMSSKKGEIVADFFCGSGTTLSAAEKLGRRWIGCDISRYAVHITRKRMLEIENSKDIIEENGDKYDKNANPFEILNLGKYERQIWQGITFNNKSKETLLSEYLAFILRLYGAEPISGLDPVHGKKGNALIYVGAVDAPVTIQDITSAMSVCKTAGQKNLHVLGWEWEMGLNDAIQEMAKNEKINLLLRIIPNEVMDQRAVEKKEVKFFELAYFKADSEVKKQALTVKLKDFVIPHTDLIPNDVKDKIKKWSDWIDYWAVDFNFQNDTFNNQWTTYRTKKDRELQLKSTLHTYDKPGKYTVLVKVVDIFGIDTSQIFEVKVE
jgi:adenine-specific DNA-methyltransferase